MTSAFESLSGPGKALRAEAPDKRDFERFPGQGTRVDSP